MKKIPAKANGPHIRVDEEEAGRIVDEALGFIIRAVARGERVVIKYFGSFVQKKYTQPAVVKYVGSKAGKVSVFKASNSFGRLLREKDSLNVHLGLPEPSPSRKVRGTKKSILSNEGTGI